MILEGIFTEVLIKFLVASSVATATTVEYTAPNNKNVLSAASFGAIAGDNVDDTAALKRALQSSQGKTLIIPPGRYEISAPIEVAVKSSSLRVLGSGAIFVSTVKDQGSEAGILTLNGLNSSLSIENLNISHSAKAVGSISGLLINGGFSRVKLMNVSSEGASRWGIHIKDARSGIVSSCQATNNRYGGLGLSGCENIRIINGEYSRNGTSAPNEGYGISLASYIRPSKNVHIIGTKAASNKRKGIDVHNGENVLIQGNRVFGFERAGIYATNSGGHKRTKNVIIRNNWIDGTGSRHFVYGVEVGSYGSRAKDSGNFIISENIIHNTSYPKSSAIFVHNPTSGGESAEKVHILGNDIRNGASQDSYCVRITNKPVPHKEVIVRNNDIHAERCLGGIGILNAYKVLVQDNSLSFSLGNVRHGILVLTTGPCFIQGNTFSGGANIERYQSIASPQKR